MRVLVNGKGVDLTQTHFLGQGGQAEVFARDGYAYKIYHDLSKAPPVNKLTELSNLKDLSNVLVPHDIVYSASQNPIGFRMPYIQKTEHLCRLFSKGFRDKNNISEQDIAALVKRAQDTLKQIHSRGFLVVDYNPFNFLTNGSYGEFYHIDTDSYKTPSYPADALMESIRDRKVVKNNFTELSDFFSWGCVMFELYTGCHPYKGRHPDFSPKDWLEMMNRGISVFNKKCHLPPGTQDLSVIPKGHLRWFESVFERGERSIPPEPDAIAPSGPTIAKIIQGNDKFNIVEIRDYKSKIKALRFIDGVCWAVTDEAIWGEDKKFYEYARESSYVYQRTVFDIAPVQGGRPVLLEWNKIDGKLRYYTFDYTKKTLIGEINCDTGFFVYNRAVYIALNGSLIELSFLNSGIKTTALQQIVGNVFHNHKVFDGIILQDMLGTCRASIPFECGRCALVHIKELDRSRIVEAKFNSGVAVVLSEKGGVNYRHTIVFSKDYSSYNVRIERDAELIGLELEVKDNGVCVATNGDKLEIFIDNAKVKVLDSPLNGGENLITFKNGIFIVNNNKLHSLTSK